MDAGTGHPSPPAKAPVGNYASAVRGGNLLFTSGRAPSAVDAQAVHGQLGDDTSTAEGYPLARPTIECSTLSFSIKA